jgi:anaerobic selenocysteine-containing dehydrogenase
MHNVPILVSGHERCVLLVHPIDVERAGVRDGEVAVLESRVHRGFVPVHVTNEMTPGVVSCLTGGDTRTALSGSESRQSTKEFQPTTGPTTAMSRR